MWLLLPLATPFSVLGWMGGAFLAQETGGPGISNELLAPLGAAVPFALLALWIIRRQEQVIDGLTAELRRVNDESVNRFISAINDSANLHREQSILLRDVIDEFRRRPIQ